MKDEYKKIIEYKLIEKHGDHLFYESNGDISILSNNVEIARYSIAEIANKMDAFFDNVLVEVNQSFGKNVSKVTSKRRELHEKLMGANSDYKYAEIYLDDLAKHLIVEDEGNRNERLVPTEIDSGLNFKIKNEISKTLKLDFNSFKIQNNNWFVSRSQVYDRETFSTKMKYVVKYKVAGHFDGEQFKSSLDELTTIKKNAPYKSGFEVVYIDDGEEGASAKYVKKDF